MHACEAVAHACRCAMDATDAGLALSFSFPGSPHLNNGPNAPASADDGGVRLADAAVAAPAIVRDAATSGTGAAAAGRAAPDGCVDLNDVANKVDSRPLLPGCTCTACRNHSRCGPWTCAVRRRCALR